jgi:hypothetical protein
VKVTWSLPADCEIGQSLQMQTITLHQLDLR